MRSMRLMTLVLLAAGSSGCANLTAVSDFAALAAATADYRALTSDYVAALERRKQFEPEQFHAELERIQARRTAQLADLQELQQLLAAYMHTVGTLALNQPVNFDKPVASLARGLNRTGLLADTDTEAAAALAALLARVVTDSQRQQQLRQLLAAANPPLQQMLGAIRTIVHDGMAADLEVERELVQRFYSNLLLRPGHPDEPVAAVLAGWARATDLAAVEQRSARASRYLNAIDAIARGHQLLCDGRNRLTQREFQAQLSAYARAMLTAYQSLE
jgi:hypothetical protein